jgi:uncharacterized protein with PQ loop repeat
MTVDVIGWLSSLLLIATMAKQIGKQWRARATEAVSKWLYLGQFVAEIGFVAYSYLVRNWVFLFTNVILLLLNCLGFFLLLRQRARARAGG